MTPQDRIIDHYDYPYHRHIPTKPCGLTFFFSGAFENEGCEDYIKWWGRYDTSPEKRIVGLWWEGNGCCFSQAVASMLAEHCEARRLYEVKAFTQDDMLILFGVNVEPGRVECVMVALNALHKALEDHDV
jgi:NifU-like protein involved in Fe-S cluster formation